MGHHVRGVAHILQGNSERKDKSLHVAIHFQRRGEIDLLPLCSHE